MAKAKTEKAKVKTKAKAKPKKTLGKANASIAVSCWAVVMPSADLSSTPSSWWALRPATRTMKNSSRLLAEMDRKRNRSSSGCPSLQASSRTRRLKASQLSSRLK